MLNLEIEKYEIEDRSSDENFKKKFKVWKDKGEKGRKPKKPEKEFIYVPVIRDPTNGSDVVFFGPEIKEEEDAKDMLRKIRSSFTCFETRMLF